jgi:hypothetical protein
VLAAIVGFELRNTVGAGAPLSTRPVQRAAPFEGKLLPPLPPIQAEQYAEFTARPLWVPTRRPAPAAAAPSTYTPGQFVLQGVIVAGDTRTAMLREKANGKLHRVEAGKQLNGITVAEISPESVTLAQGGDREVVPLQVQKPGAPGTPGVPGAPGAHPPQAQFGPAPNVPTPHQAAAPMPMPLPPGGVQGGGPFPSATPTAPAGAPAPPVPVPVPGANGQQVPGSQNAPLTRPMSAEELLARRRARRGQQNP